MKENTSGSQSETNKTRGDAKTAASSPSSNTEYIRELERENFDLVAKCIELINVIGWDEDGTYTFKDGDRWAKFDPDPKLTRGFRVGEV